MSKKMTDQNVLDFGMAIFYWHLSNRRGKAQQARIARTGKPTHLPRFGCVRVQRPVAEGVCRLRRCDRWWCWLPVSDTVDSSLWNRFLICHHLDAVCLRYLYMGIIALRHSSFMFCRVIIRRNPLPSHVSKVLTNVESLLNGPK